MAEVLTAVRKGKITPAEVQNCKRWIQHSALTTSQLSAGLGKFHTHWASPSSVRGLGSAQPGGIPEEDKEDEEMLRAHRRKAEGHELQDVLRTLGFFGLQNKEEGRQPRKGAQRCTNGLQPVSK